jgi:putative nucleotidyltransferase with HDIG domain
VTDLPLALPASAQSLLAHVPAFSSVALKLPALLADEEASVAGVAACIASDPVLSGQLIRRANAADQANYCEVRTVMQAVGALGMDHTRDLAMAFGTAAYLRGKSAVLKPCWTHSLAAALIASDLARLCGLRPAEVFTAAILHNIGRFALLNASTPEYEAILADAGASQADVLAAEQRIFGVDHVTAGAWLAREWELPQFIRDVIAHHHQQPENGLDQVTIVQIGCRLASLLGYSIRPTAEGADGNEILAPLPSWIRAQVTAQLPVTKAAIVREIRLYGYSEQTSEDTPAADIDAANEAPGAASEEQRDLVAGKSRTLVAGALLAGGIAACAVIFLLLQRF